jgi:cysteine desulfurase / selenocysteine lyase
MLAIQPEAMTTSSNNTIEPLRGLCEQMSPSTQMAYFDHAALAPLPHCTAQRIRDFATAASTVGNVQWLDWLGEAEEARSEAARMIGASDDEISFVPNTTAGINLVAEGLDWREGDNVVTLADEFPTNLYPWLHLESRGVECRLVSTDNGTVDYDELAAACDRKTRVVSVSWVGYQTGYRIDLERFGEIAHRSGALFNVDAIQGMGVFPIDVAQSSIDFLATGGQKWLLGPEGVGFAYIRSEHLDKLRPTNVGWNSVAKPFDYTHIDLTFKPSAARFAGGGWNMLGALAMGQSLKLLNAVGAENVAARVLEYTDWACDRLMSAGAVITTNRDARHRGGDQRSGIVFFVLPGRDPVEFRKRCIERNIVLSCRAGKLRISPHAYNTEEDLERLLEVIRDSP